MSETPSAENSAEIQQKKVVGRPFPKGVSGNPKGKPKGARHMSTLLEKAIKRLDKEQHTPHDILIIRTLVQRAKRGDMDAIKLIFDRVDGKVTQDIDLTTGGESLAPSPETQALVNTALAAYLNGQQNNPANS